MKQSIILKNITENTLEKIAGWYVENQQNLPSYICLNGEVGAGKTTFSRYLTHVANEDIDFSSPTYSIVNIYEMSEFTIYHFDLYRITMDDYEWIHEYFENDSALFLIEWADIHPELLESIDFFELLIEYTDNSDLRDLMFTFDVQYKDIIERLVRHEGIIFEECNISDGDNIS